MTLQKLVVPMLLLVTLLLAACGSSAPAATEAPAAAEIAASEATTDTTAAATTSVETADTEGEAASYVVDVAASSVTWHGSKPIGVAESGTVAIAEGQMNFAGEQLVDGTIIIDMTSIATTSQSGGMAEQLVGHLSSDDFFGVATYPTAQLVLKSVEATATANQYLVKADLTIKETTKEIEFVTDVAVADDTLNGSAEIIVNRADFDVRYNSAAFFSGLGDDLISDEMTITVALVAQKA